MSGAQSMVLTEVTYYADEDENGERMEDISSSKKGGFFFFNWTRFVILVVTVACLTFSNGNTLILNFTVICMDDVSANQTDHWLESSIHRNLLFSAIGMGNIIGSIPITHLFQRIGVRNIFLLYGMLSVVSTAAFPFVVQMNYAIVFAVRLLQGFAMAISLPGSCAVCAVWSPLKEMGVYMAVLSMQYQFCSIVAMPLSAEMCTSSLGWRGAFFLQSALSLFFLLFFWFFYKNDPAKHRNVSRQELSRVSLGKEQQTSVDSVPYKAIIKTPVVIALWLASIAGTIGYQLLLMFGPTYLNKVLHFEVTSTGLATTLPYILSIGLKFVLGPLSDSLTILSETTKVVIFASLSQGLMAVAYLVLAISSNAILSQIAYTSVVISSGINVIGTMKCTQLVCRQFTPFVMSVTTVITCTCGLLIPIVVTTFAPNNTPHEWSRLFFVIIVIIIASNVPFLCVARTEAAEWTGVSAPLSVEVGSKIAPTSPPVPRK